MKRINIRIMSGVATLLCLVAVVFAGCKKDNEEEKGTAPVGLLVGEWRFSTGTVVTIGPDEEYGFLTSFGPDEWQEVANRGLVELGDPMLRNIKWKKGNVYTCQLMLYNRVYNLYEIIISNNATLTLSEDHNSFFLDCLLATATLYRVTND